MGLTISESGGGDFSPLAEGTHIGRCVRVIDLGLQPGSAQYPDAKHKVLFVWEVPGETINIDGEDKPSLLMKRYTSSLHKKSQLRADLESWRGRSQDVTGDEHGGTGKEDTPARPIRRQGRHDWGEHRIGKRIHGDELTHGGNTHVERVGHRRENARHHVGVGTDRKRAESQND